MPSFYNGKRFFLTYPRCDAEPQELVDFLLSKGDIRYYVVAREKHEDGTPHLHACVEFKEVQRHDARWLDFKGKHCNKQDPRKFDACKQYCKKDGDFLESELPMEAHQVGSLANVVAVAGSETEWMQYCVDNKITYQYARWYWDRLRGDNSSIVADEHPGQICEALKSLKFDVTSRKCLVLNGPSGCGKTTWAKRNVPKPALFVCHVDQLKKFIPGYHVSIIFDDVSFVHFPRHAQIHLLDFDNVRAIHCRHAVAVIPAGIHKVFTCNEWPVIRGDEAIERRIKCVKIN